MKKIFLILAFLTAILSTAQGFPSNVLNTVSTIGKPVTYDQVLRTFDRYGSLGDKPLTWVNNGVTGIQIETRGLEDVQLIVQGSNDGTTWVSMSVYNTAAPTTIITGAFATQPSNTPEFWRVTDISMPFYRIRRSVQATQLSQTKYVLVYLKRTEPPKHIHFDGDSMSASTGTDPGEALRDLMQNAHPDYLCTVDAIGGQASGQILARQGGLYLNVTTTNTLQNTAYDLSYITYDFLKNPNNTADIQGGLMKNTACILEYTPANTNPYAVRSIAGTGNITVSANSRFIPFSASNGKKNIHIIWVGRNNSANGNGTFAGIVDQIDRAVAYLDAPKRFIVLGVAPNSGETIGTSTRAALDAHNSLLAAKYPNNYVSAYPPTLAEMAMINYTPTTTDLAQLATGIWTDTMRVDPTHLNVTGYKIIHMRHENKLLQLGY